MFVGYALYHDGDCYHMWNPNANNMVVYTTRDVIWLNRMFYRTPLAREDIDLVDFSSDEKREGNEIEVFRPNSQNVSDREQDVEVDENDSVNENGTNHDDEIENESEEKANGDFRARLTARGF